MLDRMFTSEALEEDNAPELSQGAVLKAEVFAIHLAETVLAGGHLVFKGEGNVHGHRVRIGIDVDIMRHSDLSFLFLVWEQSSVFSILCKYGVVKRF